MTIDKNTQIVDVKIGLTAISGTFSDSLTVSGIPVSLSDVEGITSIVQDLTPQLGGDLDVNGQSITSAGNVDINIRPAGTGGIELFTGKKTGNAGSREIWLSTSGAGQIVLDTISNSNTGDIFIQAGGDLDLETFNAGKLDILGNGFTDIISQRRLELESVIDDVRIRAGLEVSMNAPLRGDGTADVTAPAYSFITSTAAGMYLKSGAVVGLTGGGIETLTVSGVGDLTDGVGIAGNLTVSGTVAAVSGTFATSLTVSGIPVDITGGGGPYPTEITATATASTTSTSYVLITGMTSTPVAGTYSVSFSTTIQGDTAAQDMEVALFQDGNLITHTERSADFESGAQGDDLHYPTHTQALMTVSGSQAIEARYKTSAGTISAFQRSLFLLQLS